MGYSFDPWILNRERLRSKAIFCVVLAMVLCTPLSLRADTSRTLTLQEAISLALRYNSGVVANKA